MNPLNARLMAGLCLWLVFCGLTALFKIQFGIPTIFVLLFALAPSVMVAPTLSRQFPYEKSFLFHRVLKLEFLAACLCLSSFFLSPSWISGLYVVPWVGICFSIAWFGLFRLLSTHRKNWEEVCINFGLMFIAVGGIWLLFARLGLRPLNFSSAIVFLTAVHFHFAGFASCLILGISGRILMQEDSLRPIYTGIIITSILGIPLLAIGITLSPFLEVGAGTLFAISLLAWALLLLFRGIKSFQNPLSRGLLTIAAVSVVFSMFWALAYALGTYLNQVWVSIPQMGWRHGLFNVLGYALPALLALGIEQPQPREVNTREVNKAQKKKASIR